MSQTPIQGREKRWHDEAAFFDESAACIRAGPIDPLALARYSGPLRRRFSIEYRFRLPGGLRGKKILDVGCGDGTNAVLLALRGADVTGIDISPKLIEIAGKRAEINRVAGRCRFVCGPVQTAELPADSFDIIWGDAVLHHLIPELAGLMEAMTCYAKPGALIMFGEPVNFNQTLRRIRFLIPVKTDATPEERPLEAAEIEILRRYIPGLEMRMFTLLGRLDRFTLSHYNYERSSWPRRAIANLCASIDWMALSIPGLKNLGGSAVIHGHPRKGSTSGAR